MGFLNRFSKPDIRKLKSVHDIDGLIRALDYKNREIQIEAAQALGEFADERAVRPLINVAVSDQSEDKELWLAASASLMKFGKEPIISALYDRKQDRRGMLLPIVVNMDKERDMEHIIAAMSDPSPELRSNAVLMAGELCDPSYHLQFERPGRKLGDVEEKVERYRRAFINRPLA